MSSSSSCFGWPHEMKLFPPLSQPLISQVSVTFLASSAQHSMCTTLCFSKVQIFYFLKQWFSEWKPHSSRTSPGNLLEMQIIKPHPRTDWGSPGRIQPSCLTSPPGHSDVLKDKNPGSEQWFPLPSFVTWVNYLNLLNLSVWTWKVGITILLHLTIVQTKWDNYVEVLYTVYSISSVHVCWIQIKTLDLFNIYFRKKTLRDFYGMCGESFVLWGSSPGPHAC
jgi:hypothetical protein